MKAGFFSIIKQTNVIVYAIKRIQTETINCNNKFLQWLRGLSYCLTARQRCYYRLFSILFITLRRARILQVLGLTMSFYFQLVKYKAGLNVNYLFAGLL